jgi:hypothetical protein
MKRTFIEVVLLGLVLWLGSSLGYHRGLHEERRAWEATEQTSLVAVTNKGRPTIQSSRHSYSNPHLLPLYHIAEPTGRAAETRINQPDPRTTQQYEHSSP